MKISAPSKAKVILSGIQLKIVKPVQKLENVAHHGKILSIETNQELTQKKETSAFKKSHCDYFLYVQK